MIQMDAQSRHAKMSSVIRLLAFSLSTPPLIADSVQRDAIMRARSTDELIHLLSHNYSAVDESDQLAALRQELKAAQDHNSKLARRLDTLATENAGLVSQHKADTAELSLWQREASKSTGVLASLRKGLAVAEARTLAAGEENQKKLFATERLLAYVLDDRDKHIKFLEAELARRDAAYVALQGVSARNFENLQVAAKAYMDGDSFALREAKSIIASQRASIYRLQKVARRKGSIPVDDPYSAAAAAAGLDVPSLSLEDPQLNARLCKVLAQKYPEILNVSPDQDVTFELRIKPSSSGSTTGSAKSSTTGSASHVNSLAASAVGSTGQVHSPAVSAVDSTSQSSQPTRPRVSAGQVNQVRSLSVLRRLPMSQLTPTERRRRLSNPTSPTAAGPHLRKVWASKQPYSCPLPGEERYEEAKALLKSVSPIPGQDSDSSEDLNFIFPPHPKSRKTLKPAPKSAAETKKTPKPDPKSAAGSTPKSKSAPKSAAGSTTKSVSQLNLSSSTTPPISVVTEDLSGDTVDDHDGVDQASIELEPTSPVSSVTMSIGSHSSRTSTPSSTPRVLPVSESGPPLDVSASVASTTSVSTVSTSSGSLSGPTGSTVGGLSAASSVLTSSVSRLLSCSRPLYSSSNQPTLGSPALASPSGRPMRMAAANSRLMTAHYMDSLKASDHQVLGPRYSSSDSSAEDVLRGSSSNPMSVASGSSFLDDGQASNPSPVDSQLLGDGLSRQLFGSDDSNDGVALDGEVGAVPSSLPISPNISSSSKESKDERRAAKQARKLARQQRGLTRGLNPKHKHKHKHRSRVDSPDEGKAGSGIPSTKRSSKKRRKPSGRADSPDEEEADSGAPSTKRPRQVSGGLPPSSAPSQSTRSRPGSQVSRVSGSTEQNFPAVLSTTMTDLRLRAIRASSRDARMPVHLERLKHLKFFHFGSSRCWQWIVEHQSAKIPRELVDGKSTIPATPCSLAGLRAFADVYAPNHPCQVIRRLLPDTPMFFSPSVLEAARVRVASRRRPASLTESLADVWVKLRGDGAYNSTTDLSQLTKYFVALYERGHWLVESSVVMGLHPSQHPTLTTAEIVEMFELWTRYRGERKRRGDNLLALMKPYHESLYSAMLNVVDGQLAPSVDVELYFEPSVPQYHLVNLPWIPSSADWNAVVQEVDQAEPWRSWWLTDPTTHPFNTCFRTRNVNFLFFAPKGVDPRFIEDVSEEDVDLDEPAPLTYPPNAPSRENRLGLDIFGGSEIGELGPTLEDQVSVNPPILSEDGSPNLMGGSPTECMMNQGSPVPEAVPGQEESASALTMGLLVHAAEIMSPAASPDQLL